MLISKPLYLEIHFQMIFKNTIILFFLLNQVGTSKYIHNFSVLFLSINSLLILHLIQKKDTFNFFI